MTFGAGGTRVPAALLGPAVLAAIVLAAVPARAQGQPRARPIWAEVEFGGGPMRRDLRGAADNPGQLALNASMGWVLDEHLLVGVQAGFQAALGGPDDAPGSFNGVLMGVARIYPSKMSGLHLRLGGGGGVMTDRRSGYESDASALFAAVWEAGVGFDVKARGNRRVGPFVAWRWSAARGLRERSLTIGLAWTGL